MRPSSLTLARTVRMSDDLSPAEQARAARWAAEWLNDAGWKSKFAAASAAVDALKRHADEMDPPESVESLRAERDKALTNARTWEDLADGWRDRAIELRGEARQLRDELHKAKAEIFRLRFNHTEPEAARGRCSRED